MEKKLISQCAACEHPIRERACMSPKGKGAKGCPTMGSRTILEKARKEYDKEDIREFARQASIQEGECYAGRDKKPFVMHPVKPRILEIVEFAEKMAYKKLGLVFCMGLSKEAALVNEMPEHHGFDVVSIVCKAGCVSKDEIGVKDDEKIQMGKHETMCNPILQAMVANEAETDFNILLGLCVGHDSLFFKYADAPTTVLAVKDRVTGHNPLAAIYTMGNFYSWVKSGKS
ncbi:MAG: DUF1847 domain-containing protein [Proteobacteria bacterium]|nr:DUF1847 domain-containing protein [Pseudomonadota bacterium]